MQRQLVTMLLLWALLTASGVHHGLGARCGNNIPTVKQSQLGSDRIPKFIVEVKNNCAMCPVIDIHVKCGNFSQTLVNMKLFKVVGYDDCIVNQGLPLAPLQKLSFSYSNHHMIPMTVKTWFFQCE
ncbi:Uncharacterized protein QJS10_CPB04g01375 [Acorus calamus]|uniref:Uncharacterized protein n=1 Tax=Acorus calamus TaxID=4465 RepID=A0AAV9EYA1_ACOCL|nr:Uncharacterized protein QJS10_CPB04g01375 [Acorus calamus]